MVGTEFDKWIYNYELNYEHIPKGEVSYKEQLEAVIEWFKSLELATNRFLETAAKGRPQSHRLSECMPDHIAVNRKFKALKSEKLIGEQLDHTITVIGRVRRESNCLVGGRRQRLCLITF